ncbi:hypothetical protein PUR49_08720 [Streptomyces sp. BE147]|uniref:hypothetical protein n=1 Tax=Streptomyces sp. BE147 TaxID=3002524 RepID=UPI002E7920E0|nr:hypothetical protein [Streptomyces sp. BE147]MEE1736583.1 hypothetical protein [Streptomyces sp. BE147]
MRKIIAGLFSSLDGVVEAPETWNMPYNSAESGAALQRLFENADTALLGRSTYQRWSTFFPTPPTSRYPPPTG